MMRFLFTVFSCATLLISLAFRVPLQEPQEFRLLRSFAVEAKDMQTDRLGNLFIVTRTNQLYKYSQAGKPLSTLNYKYIGNIEYIDPTNPLELYVFYKELNQVVFLDNNLAYRGDLNLTDAGIGQAAAIARSYDNGIWVFDLADLQLKKLNKSGETLQSSGNVKQVVNGTIAPNFIYDDNEHVYVNDPTSGILVFDIFASYIKTIPIQGCTEFKIFDKELYYTTGRNLVKYNMETTRITPFALPDTSSSVKAMSVEKERLYLMKQDSVHIFSFR
jgi:hypothetical protein